METIPGWAHEIKNVGTNELIVMVWANEIFDKNNPDTFPHEVKNDKAKSNDSRGNKA